MPTSSELKSLKLYRSPVMGEGLRALERSIAIQAEKLWVISCLPEKDRYRKEVLTNELLEDCIAYYGHLSQTGEWQSLFNVAFSYVLKKYDPTKARSGKRGFLNFLESRFKVERNRCITKEYGQEEGRESIDGDYGEINPEMDGRLAYTDGRLEDLNGSEEDDELDGGTKMEYLFFEMARLIIEFKNHQADRRTHSEEAKLDRSMCYTDKMTSIIKRQRRYEGCRLMERHERDTFEAMELPFLNFYMVAPCSSIGDVWNTKVKEQYLFASEKRLFDPEKDDNVEGWMLDTWEVENDAYIDYLYAAKSRVISRPRVSQIKNSFTNLMLQSRAICNIYIERGFIIAKKTKYTNRSDGHAVAIRRDEYELEYGSDGKRRAYHLIQRDPDFRIHEGHRFGCQDGSRSSGERAKQRKTLSLLCDSVKNRNYQEAFNLLELETDSEQWKHRITKLLTSGGMSDISRRDRERFEGCLTVLVEEWPEMRVRTMGGPLVIMALNAMSIEKRNANRRGQDKAPDGPTRGTKERIALWMACRCCKAVLDAYELGKMDNPNANNALKILCDALRKEEASSSQADSSLSPLEPVLSLSIDENSIIHDIETLVRQEVESKSIPDLLEVFFRPEGVWRLFCDAGIPVGFYRILTSFGELEGFEGMGRVLYEGVPSLKFWAVAERCFLKMRSAGTRRYGTLALMYDNGLSRGGVNNYLTKSYCERACAVAKELYVSERDVHRCVDCDHEDDVTFIYAMCMRRGIGCKKDKGEAHKALRALVERDYRDAFREFGVSCLERKRKEDAAKFLTRGMLLGVPGCKELFEENGLYEPYLTVIYESVDYGSEEWEYELDGMTGNATIIRRANTIGKSSDVHNVIVPASWHGHPVTSIGECAFSGPLRSVKLQEGLERIERNAFSGCESLVSVSLPNSLKTVGEGAFRDCQSLKSISLPEGLKEIGNEAFLGCRSLESVYLPSTVEAIGERVFDNCERINVSFSEGSYAEQWCNENNGRFEMTRK